MVKTHQKGIAAVGLGKSVFKRGLPIFLAMAGLWFVLFTLGLFGEALRTHTLEFVAIWLLCPVVTIYAGRSSSTWLPAWKSRIRITFTCICTVISLGLFANFDPIKDTLGDRFIEGYQVDHEMVDSDFGRPPHLRKPRTRRQLAIQCGTMGTRVDLCGSWYRATISDLAGWYGEHHTGAP